MKKNNKNIKNIKKISNNNINYINYINHIKNINKTEYKENTENTEDKEYTENKEYIEHMNNDFVNEGVKPIVLMNYDLEIDIELGLDNIKCVPINIFNELLRNYELNNKNNYKNIISQL